MIIPDSRYPGRTERNADYQWGRARNATEPGNGTPFDAAWLADLWGQTAAVLRAAGIEPSGEPDTITHSQFADAVEQVIKERVRARGRGFDLRRAVPTIFRRASSRKLLAISPDGSSIYVQSTSALDVLQLRLLTAQDLRGGLDRVPESHLQLANPVRSLAFLPGGRLMTIVDESSVLEYQLERPWQIATATQLKETPHGGLVHALLLRPSEVRVAYGPRGWTIGAASRALTVSGPPQGLAISPDGNSMVLALQDEQGAATRLLSWPIEAGAPASAVLPHIAALRFDSAPVTPNGESISGLAWSADGRRLFVGTTSGLLGQLDTFHL